MKILIAGPESVHVSNFCSSIRPLVDEIVLVSEKSFPVQGAVRSYVVSFRGSFFSWFFSFLKLKRIIADEKPDVVHVHQINRLAFFLSAALKKSAVPLVSTAWGSDVLLVPGKNFMYRKMVSSVISRSRFVTADARVMIDEMGKLVAGKDKFRWLLYGIDMIEPSAREKIIFSNRLHEKLYNVDLIIRDFAAFSLKNHGWKLYIGGSGSLTGELKNLAASLGISESVEFLGWQNREANNANYARSSIYVSVPSSDGTSVSLLEAMSAGCIPVVSDLPVSHEWIEDGVNGIIWKGDKNPFEMALQLDAAKCFKINRDKIFSSALRGQMAEKFCSLYKRCLSKE